MEERSRKGKGIASSMLPSLPPRPEEISPEAVSHEPYSGQARPAESSASLSTQGFPLDCRCTKHQHNDSGWARRVKMMFSYYVCFKYACALHTWKYDLAVWKCDGARNYVGH